MPASLHTVIVNLDDTLFFFVDMIRGQGTKKWIVLRNLYRKGYQWIRVGRQTFSLFIINYTTVQSVPRTTCIFHFDNVVCCLTLVLQECGNFSFHWCLTWNLWHGWWPLPKECSYKADSPITALCPAIRFWYVGFDFRVTYEYVLGLVCDSTMCLIGWAKVEC